MTSKWSVKSSFLRYVSGCPPLFPPPDVSRWTIDLVPAAGGLETEIQRFPTLVPRVQVSRFAALAVYETRPVGSIV